MANLYDLVYLFSVNNNWGPDIVDLALNNLVLKRILNVQDLTLCLDKCSASGKIEVYEDPLFYRCSLCIRLHMVYESSNARVPYITKANLNCDKLNFSISNIQVRFFFFVFFFHSFLLSGTNVE